MHVSVNDNIPWVTVWLWVQCGRRCLHSSRTPSRPTLRVCSSAWTHISARRPDTQKPSPNCGRCNACSLFSLYPLLPAHYTDRGRHQQHHAQHRTGTGRQALPPHLPPYRARLPTRQSYCDVSMLSPPLTACLTQTSANLAAEQQAAQTQADLWRSMLTDLAAR